MSLVTFTFAKLPNVIFERELLLAPNHVPNNLRFMHNNGPEDNKQLHDSLFELFEKLAK